MYDSISEYLRLVWPLAYIVNAFRSVPRKHVSPFLTQIREIAFQLNANVLFEYMIRCTQHVVSYSTLAVAKVMADWEWHRDQDSDHTANDCSHCAGNACSHCYWAHWERVEAQRAERVEQDQRRDATDSRTRSRSPARTRSRTQSREADAAHPAGRTLVPPQTRPAMPPEADAVRAAFGQRPTDATPPTAPTSFVSTPSTSLAASTALAANTTLAPSSALDLSTALPLAITACHYHCQVLVQGFDFCTSDEQVAAHCSTVGEVVAVQRIKEDVAIVAYGTPSEAGAAVSESQGKTIEGHGCSVEVLAPSTISSETSG